MRFPMKPNQCSLGYEFKEASLLKSAVAWTTENKSGQCRNEMNKGQREYELLKALPPS